MLTMLSLMLCLFFAALKSSEIVDAIEHSGGRGLAHSHSVISLASLDADHDAHELRSAQHQNGSPSDEGPSKPDLAHHHHHTDIGCDGLILNGPSSDEPFSYAIVDRPAERIFRAFGPSDGLKRPPRRLSHHA